MSCIYSHEDGAYCDKHSHGAVTLSCSGEEDCSDRIVQTNSDRIRQMSDEELARLFDDILKYNVVGEPDENVCSDCYKTDCAPCWLDWLKSPVEVDNGT